MSEDKYESELIKRTEKVTENDLVQTISKEEAFWNLVNKVKVLRKYAGKFRIFWEMVKDYYNGNYKEIPWSTIAVAVATIIYILSPVDLIPDAIPGIGFTDDIAVFVVAWKFIEEDLIKYSQWKCEQNITDTLKEAIKNSFDIC